METYNYESDRLYDEFYNDYRDKVIYRCYLQPSYEAKYSFNYNPTDEITIESQKEVGGAKYHDAVIEQTSSRIDNYRKTLIIDKVLKLSNNNVKTSTLQTIIGSVLETEAAGLVESDKQAIKKSVESILKHREIASSSPLNYYNVCLNREDVLEQATKHTLNQEKDKKSKISKTKTSTTEGSTKKTSKKKIGNLLINKANLAQKNSRFSYLRKMRPSVQIDLKEAGECFLEGKEALKTKTNKMVQLNVGKEIEKTNENNGLVEKNLGQKKEQERFSKIMKQKKILNSDKTALCEKNLSEVLFDYSNSCYEQGFSKLDKEHKTVGGKPPQERTEQNYKLNSSIKLSGLSKTGKGIRQATRSSSLSSTIGGGGSIFQPTKVDKKSRELNIVRTLFLGKFLADSLKIKRQRMVNKRFKIVDKEKIFKLNKLRKNLKIEKQEVVESMQKSGLMFGDMEYLRKMDNGLFKETINGHTSKAAGLTSPLPIKQVVAGIKKIRYSKNKKIKKGGYSITLHGNTLLKNRVTRKIVLENQKSVNGLFNLLNTRGNFELKRDRKELFAKKNLGLTTAKLNEVLVPSEKKLAQSNISDINFEQEIFTKDSLEKIHFEEDNMLELIYQDRLIHKESDYRKQGIVQEIEWHESLPVARNPKEGVSEKDVELKLTGSRFLKRESNNGVEKTHKLNSKKDSVYIDKKHKHNSELKENCLDSTLFKSLDLEGESFIGKKYKDNMYEFDFEISEKKSLDGAVEDEDFANKIHGKNLGIEWDFFISTKVSKDSYSNEEAFMEKKKNYNLKKEGEEFLGKIGKNKTFIEGQECLGGDDLKNTLIEQGEAVANSSNGEINVVKEFFGEKSIGPTISIEEQQQLANQKLKAKIVSPKLVKGSKNKIQIVEEFGSKLHGRLWFMKAIGPVDLLEINWVDVYPLKRNMYPNSVETRYDYVFSMYNHLEENTRVRIRIHAADTSLLYEKRIVNLAEDMLFDEEDWLQIEFTKDLIEIRFDREDIDYVVVEHYELPSKSGALLTIGTNKKKFLDEKHPFTGLGLDIDNLEMEVSIPIMVDFINIMIMFWSKFADAFACFNAGQAIKRYLGIIYEWITLDTSMEAESIDHYHRAYAWVRWNAEMLYEKHKTRMDFCGNAIIEDLIFELIDYMKKHHVDLMPLWHSIDIMDMQRGIFREVEFDIPLVLDKIKGVRKRIIDNKEDEY